MKRIFLALAVLLALQISSMIGASAVRAVPVAHTSPTPGYWLAGADGGVFAFNAPFEGSGAPTASSPGTCPFISGPQPTINVSVSSLIFSGQVTSEENCVGIAASEAGAGYWLANYSSLPSAFGSAAAAIGGSQGCTGLNGAEVGWSAIAATPSGHGFFLVSPNGGVLGCGDATPVGGVTDLHLSNLISGIAVTPDGKGYWLVGFDGGVFAFGDARFYGSMGGTALNLPVVGIAATPDGMGYWLVGADGGVFSFGDAVFYGSMGGRAISGQITDIAANPDGPGYWLVASDGGVFAFGGAAFEGSMGGTRLDAPIVGIAVTPN
jgi:hypothetical protein